MRNVKRVAMYVIAFMIITTAFAFGSVEAKAMKTIKITTGKSKTITKKSFKKAKKVIVKVSNTKVCKAKYSKKKKRIKITGKKPGKTKVSITVKRKGKKAKHYKYRIKIMIKKSSSGDASAKDSTSGKEAAMKALKMVNGYRKNVGADPLEWSDELYEACLYRLKTSGYDKHANLNRDLNDFFGGFCYTISGYEGEDFAENLAMGQESVIAATKSWKKSEGHYKNMIAPGHKCCAIAKYKDIRFINLSRQGARIKGCVDG